ncbi:hypothetical protein GCM10020295_59180 [Streptomyces cinereospinus]
MSGTSALDVVTILPATCGTAGSGENRSVSAPMWTTWTRSGRTPRWSTISWREVPETVRTDGSRRATRFCIRVKAYHRRTENRRRRPSAASSSSCRSTVMGWWTVVTSGAPTSPSSPYPSVWLSCTTSKSPRRARRWRRARREKVSGSGKPPVHIVATSRASIQSRYSSRAGVRKGSGWR